MNRHQRRAAGIGNEPAPPPPLAMRIACIDPWKREVWLTTLPMSPEGAQVFMRKKAWHSATIGHEAGADVLVMGDAFPQITIIGDPEPTWMLRGGNFGPGAICHGIGGVLGVSQAVKKAVGLPVPIEWVMERIVWDPQEEE